MLHVPFSHVLFGKIVIPAVGDRVTLPRALSSHDNVAFHSCYPRRRTPGRVSYMFGGHTDHLMLSEALARSLAEGYSVYWKSSMLESCFYIQVVKKKWDA